MSDLETAYNALTPEQRAQTDALYRLQGLEAPGPTPEPPKPFFQQQPSAKSWQGESNLSAEQQIAGAAALFKVNPDAALAYVEARGIDPAKIGASGQDQPVSPNGDPVLPGLEPPSDASGYTISIPYYAKDDPLDELMPVFDAIKSGFFASGVPTWMANPLAQALLDTAADYDPENPPPAAELNLKDAEEIALAERLNGGDKETTMRLYKLAIDTFPAALRDLLEEHRAFRSPRVVAMMSNFGRVVEARRAKK